MYEVKETYINETEGMMFGQSEWEPYDGSRGDAYRYARREYGRCVSKMYRTTKTEEALEVGWVFQKRMRYDGQRWDENETYIREVWVEIREVADAS